MTRRGTPEADLQRAVVQMLRLALPRSAIIHHCANEVAEPGPRGAKRQAILVGKGARRARRVLDAAGDHGYDRDAEGVAVGAALIEGGHPPSSSQRPLPARMDFIRHVANVRNALGVMAREKRHVPRVRIIVAGRIGRMFMALLSAGATTEMVVVFGAKPETAAAALVYLVE